MFMFSNTAEESLSGGQCDNMFQKFFKWAYDGLRNDCSVLAKSIDLLTMKMIPLGRAL